MIDDNGGDVDVDDDDDDEMKRIRGSSQRKWVIFFNLENKNEQAD